ncbi:MAG: type I-B CRISPR-associated protein Cas5 [Acidobacteria bacterium]|nr:MAG: type I-B CRISPR-associated protein Cas5 [Acidobacteriota bacterium]
MRSAMHILRIRIYQPQAHYRVPFTYRRRHTYPISPYSTVIGFLCNVLGIDDQSKPEYQQLKKIKISIAGRFGSKTTEYIWFRNLSESAHVGRFGSVENRSVGGHIEHIGGQSPTRIDILDDVHLVIHLAHESEDFLGLIKNSLENPDKRLEILHLGRAEDWIVLEEVSEVMKVSKFCVKIMDKNFRYFFWIPEKIWVPDGASDNYGAFEGLLYRLPSFWTVADYEQTRNRHGQRIFEYVSAKLNDGLFGGMLFLCDEVKRSFLYDEDVKLPVFLANF